MSPGAPQVRPGVPQNPVFLFCPGSPVSHSLYRTRSCYCDITKMSMPPRPLVYPITRWGLAAATLLTLLACRYQPSVPQPALGRTQNTSVVDGVDPENCPTAPPQRQKAAGEACACDIQCETGTCSAGVCCSGSGCSALRPLGITCQSDSHCASGLCVDGVCCNVACTGACVVCNRPEQMGQCAPVPAGGEDRHGVCRKDSPETCGQTGYCNGHGGCARYAAATICREASCSDREQLQSASLCDGDGTCVPGASISCSPSTCEAGACLSSCTGDASCQAPFRCTSGSCGPRGLGQDCVGPGECASGFCIDGVCCESACGSPCTYCAGADGRGRCLPTKAGVPDQRAARGESRADRICPDEGPATCGRNGRCDGQGGCQKYADDTICGDARCDAESNRETSAPTCLAGVCRSPQPRSCAPYLGCTGNRCRSSCGADSQCVSGNVCVAGDCGRRPLGALCTRASECASDVCAQGRCCAGPCSGTCRSCALPGQEGTCASVAVGGPDPSGTCRDDACSNGCDGAGGCRREAAGTVCGAAQCAENSVRSSRCTATGVCETSSVDLCRRSDLPRRTVCRSAPAPAASATTSSTRAPDGQVLRRHLCRRAGLSHTQLPALERPGMPAGREALRGHQLRFLQALWRRDAGGRGLQPLVAAHRPRREIRGVQRPGLCLCVLPHPLGQRHRQGQQRPRHPRLPLSPRRPHPIVRSGNVAVGGGLSEGQTKADYRERPSSGGIG